jgi:cbb3-type cytochrome oxidase maturation protein
LKLNSEFRPNINIYKSLYFIGGILEIRYFNLYFATRWNNMSVILVLVAFSVVLAGGFLAAFFWSVRNGQYDDTYSASVRILFDDDKPVEATNTQSTTTKPLEEHSPNQ